MLGQPPGPQERSCGGAAKSLNMAMTPLVLSNVSIFVGYSKTLSGTIVGKVCASK